MSSGLPDLPFHDAEVVALRLGRDGPTLDIDLEIFAQLPDARIARLRFTEVVDLEIGGFNEQNVLFNLVADLAADELWDVTLQPTHGLGGRFRCASIELLP